MEKRKLPEDLHKTIIAVTLGHLKAGFSESDVDEEVTPYMGQLEREDPDLYKSFCPFLDGLAAGEYPPAPEELPAYLQDELNAYVQYSKNLKKNSVEQDTLAPNESNTNEQEIPAFRGPATAHEFLREKHYSRLDILDMPVLVLRQGHVVLAHQMVTEQYKIWERELGPEHPNTIAALNAVGYCREFSGDFENAELLYRSSLERQQKHTVAMESPYTARYASRLAHLLTRTGKYEGCRVREAGLLPLPALRTGRESFPSSGSSME